MRSLRTSGQRGAFLRVALGVAVLGATPALASAAAAPSGLGTATAGRQSDGSVINSLGQRLTSAGSQLELPGRITQIALRPDGKTATLLVSQGGPLVVIDVATRRVLQTTGANAGSFDGLAYDHAGTRLFASGAGGTIQDLSVAADGTLTSVGSVSTPTTLPTTTRGADVNSSSNNAYPGGLAFSADDKTVYVVLSVLNTLGVVDVATDTLTSQIPVGNAPHSVVLDGTTAFVSNEGGRPAAAGDTTNDSDGTNIVASPVTGGAVTGTVSVVDLAAGKQTTTVDVGLHPTAMTLHDGTLYVADTDSDQVSVIDSATRTSRDTIAVTPFPGAPLGSQPTGVAVLTDGRLAVTLGRANALAVFGPQTASSPAVFLGLMPTGWFPSAVTQDASGQVVVTNDKGVGNQGPTSTAGDGKGKSTGSGYVGSVSFLDPPTTAALQEGTTLVAHDDGWDRIDQTCVSTTAAPVAIPAHVGEPSLIKHVIYVAKENRTYDQVLGDDTRGNGDPGLTQFDATTTPNAHALVQRFPLVDNFYDAGQLSADGHQWFVQGDAPDYLEKAFGGFTRGYPSLAFDAMAYLPNGFIWDDALAHGKKVADYGEFAMSGGGRATTATDVPSLKPLLSPTYEGFDLTVPDQVRMQIFLNDFSTWTAAGGTMPDLTLMSLPQDHTAAYAPEYPTTDAMVADNDLALGRLVQAVSASRYWADTAVIVEEDDSQNGLDHVDAHRSVFYAISPYATKGLVDHTYYSQVDSLRTVEQILGLPAMNQLDLAATPMRSLFTNTPDLTPYTALTPGASTTATNPATAALTGMARAWSAASAQMDLTRPDAVDPAVMAHADWYTTKGFDTPYPGESRVLLPEEVSGGRINVGNAVFPGAPVSTAAAEDAGQPGGAASVVPAPGLRASATCAVVAVPAGLTEGPQTTAAATAPAVATGTLASTGARPWVAALGLALVASGAGLRRRRRARS